MNTYIVTDGTISYDDVEWIVKADSKEAAIDAVKETKRLEGRTYNCVFSWSAKEAEFNDLGVCIV